MDAYERIDDELNREIDELHERYVQDEITLKEYNEGVKRLEREARAELRYAEGRD